MESNQQEAKRYERERLTCTIGSAVVELIYLCFMAGYGGIALDHYVAPIVHGHRWPELWLFALLFAVGSQLVALPFDYYSGFRLEHKFGMSRQTIGGWLVKQLKILALGGVLGWLLLTGLYAVLWATPKWWWLVASAGWLLLSVVLGQLFPVLIVPIFYKLTPIDNEALLGRFREIAQGTGIQIKDVLRLSLSQETKKANAALAGLGHTKRVMMGDTLLDTFSPQEIDAVFAHELGHSVLAHVPKGIVMSAVIGTAGFFICDFVLRRLAVGLGHASFTAVSAMPLLLLVLTIFTLALSPLERAVTRKFEREADWYSLEKTNDPQSFVAAFKRLAAINKADMDPPRIVVLLFYTHPPISERIAMAERWANLRRSGAA